MSGRVVRPSATRAVASARKAKALAPARKAKALAPARKAKAVAPARRAKAGAAAPKATRSAAKSTATPRRRDAAALIEAGRRSVAGVKAVLARRSAILRETLSELRTVARVMRHVGARRSMAHLDGLAIGLVALSIRSVREIAVLASTTQREALDVLAGQLQKDLASFRAARAKRR